MNDNVVELKLVSTSSKKKQTETNKRIIDALEYLLAAAKEGEVMSYAAVYMQPDDAAFSYFMYPEGEELKLAGLVSRLQYRINADRE